MCYRDEDIKHCLYSEMIKKWMLLNDNRHQAKVGISSTAQFIIQFRNYFFVALSVCNKTGEKYL